MHWKFIDFQEHIFGYLEISHSKRNLSTYSFINVPVSLSRYIYIEHIFRIVSSKIHLYRRKRYLLKKIKLVHLYRMETTFI